MLTGDAKTLATYRLTLPTLRKIAQVQENMYNMIVANPSLKTKYANVDNAEDDHGPQTIDDMAKRFDRIPEIKRAITSTGLTTREYSVAMLTMFQAAMTLGFMEMDGPMKLKEVPAGVLADNVTFLKANKAELDRMQVRARELEKLSKPSNSESMEEAPDTSSEEPPRR
jgi:hypothetical protein